MNGFSSGRLSRRHVLRAAGAAVSLPLFDAMLPRAWATPSTFEPLPKSEAVQPRMICCYVPNGVNIIDWVPTDTGENYTLSPTLKTLEAYRNDFTVLTGMGHPHSKGGHSGADTWLTGADLASKPGADYTNSVSIDQLVAAFHGPHTRYASVQLSDMSGTGGAGHSHTLSFDPTGSPLPAENSPRRVFERLFVPESTADRAAAIARYAERRSILDAVVGDAKSLHRRLGTTDQKKLDEYLSSVRDTEKQVERMEQWIDRPKPQVSDKGLQLDSKPIDAHDRPMWVDVMLELAYLSFLTDTTRVITFEWSREAGGAGMGGENHHELSHHGGDAGMLGKLAVIDKGHLEKLGRFMGMLKKTAEADGSMLDRTVILYGSGMNSGKGGDHSPKNLPLLVAGGSKLGVKLGRHIAFEEDKHPPLSNVLLSLAQRVGCEGEKFSDATGTLSELVS
jgi:hypothetical protein